MEIIIQSVQVTVSRALKKKLHSELSHLTMLFDRIISCEVVLRHGKYDQVATCEVLVQVRVPQHHFFALVHAVTFEQAITLAVDDLVGQLKRDKDRKWQLL